MKTKNILKSALAVAAVTLSCLGAWKAYEVYGTMDNSLMLENIEALGSTAEGTATKPEKFPIVHCGDQSAVTDEPRWGWMTKAVQYNRNCLSFGSRQALIQHKEDICQNNSWTPEWKRYLISQLFCTGPKTYFHLNEEGDKRGFCINTNNY